ncbi:hypothetical protein XH98_04680 [Bradyrhizobium sp. CCBAU 51745]|uniref:hypothetical protein n=1 Tax=Bradyrhizobium sp. CCBAU 51745 TaxID=1325099 RepID=UPI0023061017|nr:hypothetical protein [Bradyrhizobium sp. CCBAU 51745]MDA9438433.1 hypothetical protein [Bradyrhizobium sp. CCBAU 51745]
MIRKRLAKWMANLCFRENTELDGFHDRISEEEIKELMMGVVDNCYLWQVARSVRDECYGCANKQSLAELIAKHIPAFEQDAINSKSVAAPQTTCLR